MNGYIYMIHNLITHKVYIGSTNNFKRRFKKHTSQLMCDTHNNFELQNDWNKIDDDRAFDFAILEEVNLSELNKCENYWIRHYHKMKFPIYNVKDGYGHFIENDEEVRNLMASLKIGKEPSNKFIPTQECLEELINGMTQPEFTEKYGVTKNVFKRLRKELKQEGKVETHKRLSKYKGVYFDAERNKWRASIRIDKKTKTIGRADTEEGAYQLIQDYLKREE